MTNENLSLLLLLLNPFVPIAMRKVIKLMDFRLDSFSITKYEHEHEKSKREGDQGETWCIKRVSVD